MTRRPGISRDNRISDDGLQRLEKHLQRGGHISHTVNAQSTRRSRDPAREIIRGAGRYHDDLG